MNKSRKIFKQTIKSKHIKIQENSGEAATLQTKQEKKKKKSLSVSIALKGLKKL